MVLAVHSDASYLNEKKSISRAGGHFFPSKDNKMPPKNDTIHTVAKIIKVMMSSVAKSELGTLYINARETVPMRKTLEKMEHPQPRPPTDNSTAFGVINNKIQPRQNQVNGHPIPLAQMQRNTRTI